MFDPDQFVADCRTAQLDDPTHKSVREVVTRAVSDPGAVLKGLGEPQRSGVQKIYHSSDLTILNVIWGPRMTIWPHNHQMWAVIGISIEPFSPGVPKFDWSISSHTSIGS